MIDLILIPNPFRPCEDMIREQRQSGRTIRESLRDHFGPDFEEFPTATVCQLNGRPVLRKEWDTGVLKDGDHLVFVTVPQGVVAIVLAVIAIAIAIAVYFLIGDPKIPGEQGDPDSVYSLRGQTNKFRPGEPIEVVYGKCRVWPTFLTRPYSRYSGNQQYQYSLFCLGQGDFVVHNTFVDDTNTNRFDEVEVELCPPGVQPTIVESAVYQAAEVANIELLAPNEEDYTGISGPFVLNDFSTPVKRIEVDISFPSGLYRTNDDGETVSEEVTLLFEYRRIDEAGSAIGSWTEIANPEIQRATNTPQRRTFSTGVTLGRYEVRGRRTSNKPDEDTRGVSQVRWEAVKGYAPLDKDFGDVYIIAMKSRATGQLNSQTSKSFNAKCTRKVPIWSGSAWSVPTATRNPIWAFCDILRAEYGAKLSEEYLDMDKLAALATTFDSRNDWFDWVFDSTLTVWEAAKTALRVGRTTPIPQGSLITAVRDEETEVVTAMFNQHNILAGSLTKQLRLFDFQPFDGTLVEYTEQEDWKPETVKCVLPGRSGTNLERVKLPGCTNRDRALREGLYMQSRKEYQRKTVTFRTGMEGYIPLFLDLIVVTHDTIRVGQGGMILDYDEETKVMTLSEQVNFGPANLDHRIALRGDDGGLLGSPIVVTAGSEPNEVILEEDPDETLDFSPDRVPPLYAFGVADLWSFRGRVVSVKPVDFETVEVSCVNYVGDSYTHDDAVSVPVEEVPVISNPGDPEIDWVTISGFLDDSSSVNIAWSPTPGANGYVIQSLYTDGDEDEWTEIGVFNSSPATVAVNLGEVVFRVAPVSASGELIWTESDPYHTGSTTAVPGAPTASASTVFEPLEARVYWIPIGSAHGYIVDVYLPEGETPIRSENVGDSNSYFYSRTFFEADTDEEDNTNSLEFKIRGFNDGGSGAELEYLLTNALPAAPADLLASSPTADVYPLSWTGGDEDDFSHFRLYVSDTPGFTPGPGNLEEDDIATASTDYETPTEVHWVVGSVDVWGGESFSAEDSFGS